MARIARDETEARATSRDLTTAEQAQTYRPDLPRLWNSAGADARKLVAVALLPVALVGSAIRRWEGAVFVAYAVAYTTYLLLDATDHPLADDLTAVMGAFVLPLTLLTLLTVVTREMRARRPRRIG
jgi:hypothetical protein